MWNASKRLILQNVTNHVSRNLTVDTTVQESVAHVILEGYTGHVKVLVTRYDHADTTAPILAQRYVPRVQERVDGNVPMIKNVRKNVFSPATIVPKIADLNVNMEHVKMNAKLSALCLIVRKRARKGIIVNMNVLGFVERPVCASYAMRSF